jgi:hypothetical protein
MARGRVIVSPALAWLSWGSARPVLAGEPVRDVAWFLRRTRCVDHLPDLEASHTALASTWDRSGGNGDALIHQTHPAWSSTAWSSTAFW